ncbi:isochorismate synthase MenF [Nesterenkonia sp. F]|uniref:isochorismate synthase n=1 Tax=Nesterenkonia sp. F TaxID=795955 RepID=UPI000255D25B|nr:chorismate-binding protein [Nesterenkonia sp. F]
MEAPPLHSVVREVTLPDGLRLPDLLPLLTPTACWIRRSEGIVGLGVADGATASGSQRFVELARWWEERRAVVDEAPRPAALEQIPGCGPTVFTSVTYSSDSAHASHLTLPEVILGDVAGRTWVTVTTPETDDAEEGRDGGGGGDVTTVLARHGLVLGHDGTLAPAAEAGRAADDARSEFPATRLRAGAHPTEHYLDAVAAGVEAIEERRLEKLVLGRDAVVEAEAPMPRGTILAGLARDYTDCWTYLAGDLLGTTPEMLVTVRGRDLAARVLAGTVDGSLSADEARVQLLEDVKQRSEHEIAVQSLLAQLAPVVELISAQNPPAVLALPNVHHLSTDVTGRLSRTADGTLPPALTVAERAHPTAAICGTPTATAAELIAALEQLDRGPFTGPVGWIDAHGNADVGIALRGGLLDDDDRSVRLFAGCGIVAGSDPESELAETRAKLRPMLGVLGVED